MSPVPRLLLAGSFRSGVLRQLQDGGDRGRWDRETEESGDLRYGSGRTARALSSSSLGWRGRP